MTQQAGVRERVVLSEKLEHMQKARLAPLIFIIMVSFNLKHMKTAAEIINKIKTLLKYHYKHTISGRLDLPCDDLKHLEAFINKASIQKTHLSQRQLSELLNILYQRKTNYIAGYLFDELESFLNISLCQKNIWKKMEGLGLINPYTLFLLYQNASVVERIYSEFLSDTKRQVWELGTSSVHLRLLMWFLESAQSSPPVSAEELYWLLSKAFKPVGEFEEIPVDLKMVISYLHLCYPLSYLIDLLKIDGAAMEGKGLVVYENLDKLVTPLFNKKTGLDVLMLLGCDANLWIAIAILHQAKLLNYDNFYQVFYYFRGRNIKMVELATALWLAKEVKMHYLHGNRFEIYDSAYSILSFVSNKLGSDDTYKHYQICGRFELQQLFSVQMYQRDDYLELLPVILEYIVNLGKDFDILKQIINSCVEKNTNTSEFINKVLFLCIPEVRQNVYNDFAYWLVDQTYGRFEELFEKNQNATLDLPRTPTKESFYPFFKKKQQPKTLNIANFITAEPIVINDKEHTFKPGLFSLESDTTPKEHYDGRTADARFYFE